MNAGKGVLLADYCNRSNLVIHRARSLYEAMGLDLHDLPADAYDGSRPITIVFAGQHSSGKSTIIKVLTGYESIATGSGITTDKTAPYPWENLVLVDTPGIGTGLAPDDGAYKAIADADILVYVITRLGFSGSIKEDFRRLLIDEQRGEEMILVVNKMSSNKHNSPEQRAIIAQDIVKQGVTAPYTPEQLNTVYIDAESCLLARECADTDPDLYAYYMEQANFDELIRMMNSFAAQRDVALRLTQPLHKTIQALRGVLRLLDESNEDEEMRLIESQLYSELNIIESTMRSIRNEALEIVTSDANKIRDEGRALARSIDDCQNEEEYLENERRARSNVDNLVEQCNEDIIELVHNSEIKCNIELNEFFTSESMKDLQVRLSSKRSEKNTIASLILENDLLAQGSSKIVASTLGDAAASSGLGMHSGSQAHQFVLDLGHYFNHKFKPWEALKWTKRINHAGKIIGFLGVALTVGQKIKDDIDADAIARERQENRRVILGSFYGVADELEKHYRTKIREMLDEDPAFGPKASIIKQRIKQINNQKAGHNAKYKRTQNLIQECLDLIGCIQHDY